MQKFIRFFLCVTFFSGLGQVYAQQRQKTETHWYPMASLDSLMKVEKRPILIDLYTDWCGWCKVMDSKTYANADVAETIGQNYYAVKLNAESKNLLRFRGKAYGYDERYRNHELALYLTKGKLFYPQTIILMPDGSEPIILPGYIEASKMLKLLQTFAAKS